MAFADDTAIQKMASSFGIGVSVRRVEISNLSTRAV